MSNPDTHSATINWKQRVFLFGLFVLSLVISAVVLFCFSAATPTSMAIPEGNISPSGYIESANA